MNWRTGSRGPITPLALACLAAGIAACSGSGDGVNNGGDATSCTGFCQNTPQALTAGEVETIVAQAVAEAQARNAAATVAVTDRVGNVLAVYRMAGADEGILIDSGRGVAGGLEQIDVIPDTLAAIAKAVTGAYLASEGNAFSTRTASQIVQEHFNPGEFNQFSGPLFGVQFSQLPCSDLNLRNDGAAASAGPKRSPLGLSADPGGFPLYKNGTPVGGIGVIADGLYALDPVTTDIDRDLDELIALAGFRNFAAPVDRRGDRITVEGKTFRFSDAPDSAALTQQPATLTPTTGAYVAVPGYVDAAARAGTAFTTPASGVRPHALPVFSAQDAFELVDSDGAPRFRPRAGTDAAALPAAALSAAEVTTLLEEALKVANRSRAQIRRPLGSPARVSISVVDTYGAILGVVRTRDAPLFGTDVSLQKARTATFFSNAAAADDLLNTPDTTYLGNMQTASIADYVPAARSFLGSSTALADGAVAFADRSGGNLSRPFFPDGVRSAPPGPFSKPFDDWSPFSTGLQLDLVNSAILQHVVFVLTGDETAAPDVAPGACTQLPPADGSSGPNRLGNGIQIFPGSVPIYRGNQLVGGIGVSGDGVDQDDMISFLGVHNAGQRLGTLGNAPPEIRADQLTPMGTRLRYVQCPQSPFIDDPSLQNVCDGL